MYSFRALVAVLFALKVALIVRAEIYVTKPTAGSTCHGEQPCTVEWLDDGNSPLLSAIGPTRVGLYTGNQQLLQSIQPVDVSKTHSFTFVPNPKAGPNSDAYYISFTPVSGNVDGKSYSGFSPFFALDNMSGSFSSPNSGATSSSPIPSSSGSNPTNSTVSGTGSTSMQAPAGTGSSSAGSSPASTQSSLVPSTEASLSTTPVSSGFSTMLSSPASASLTSSATHSAASATHTNAAMGNKVPAAGFVWSLIGIASYMAFSLF
ncbi:hypothetical protein AX17_007024 [Amanita inopinata Kibby_2008]|nr:hypothetical protein AX17_007024 [Amanita inopinata Kibby_2008]